MHGVALMDVSCNQFCKGGYRDGGWSDEGLSFRGRNEHMALTRGCIGY